MTPFQREMRLMPYISRMEQRGVHIDIVSLKKDMNFYFNKLQELDDAICTKVKRKVDVDSNDQLADAIEYSGLSKGFLQTPTGRRSTAKESLMGAIADPTLLGDLLIRGSLATCLRTFYQPWYSAAKRDGKLYVKWNQIRNYSDTGARTGRLSSSPNFQNIPVEWEDLLNKLKGIGYVLRFDLPQMRRYVVPAPSYVFIGRDYKSQEMRLLAHFAGGKLLESLQADPQQDVHQIAAKLAGISRRTAKTLGFAILYGAGAARVAESLGVSVSAASSIKAAYLRALPEIKQYQKKLAESASLGVGITTLAGRRYNVQSPSVVKGVLKTFEYKLTNYAIQGSAADQTKEAMYLYCSNTRTGNLILSVHDQLVIEVPEDDQDSERQIFDKAMSGSFAEVLKCKFPSDEGVGHDFRSLK